MFAPHRYGVFCTLMALLLSCGLSACDTLNGSAAKVAKAAAAIEPYKIDIVQGNVVTREQVNVLKPGMPRGTVRDVLGTPLLSSLFHADRWDYIFTFKRQGGQPQSRKVTIFFKDELLDHVDADELPSESEFAATLRSKPIDGPLPPMEAPPEKLQLFPAPRQSTAPALPAAPVDYPPLEQPGK